MQGVNLKNIIRVVIVVLVGVALWVLLPPVMDQNWGSLSIRLIVLVPIALVLLWLMGAFVRIGMDGDEPYWAVIAQFGRPVEAVRPGIYFRPLWVFERVALFPTGQKTMWFRTTEAWTKEMGNRQAQPLTLDIALYMRWPDPEVDYDFDGDTGSKNGSDLLKGAYYYLPRALRNPDRPDYIDVLGRFLENAVIGAVKIVVGRRNHLDARQENQKIENEVKTYLLSEPGNPFHDLGIPPKCFDLELTRVVFPDDTAQALREKELARRAGEARVTAAEHDGRAREAIARHRKAASGDEAEAIKALLQAHLDKWVSPEVAALIVSGGVGGEGMSIEQLRDLAITMRIGTL